MNRKNIKHLNHSCQSRSSKQHALQMGAINIDQKAFQKIHEYPPRHGQIEHPPRHYNSTWQH